jgi:hypothetical protein
MIRDSAAPQVLRPAEGGENKQYRLVGEAYVHGKKWPDRLGFLGTLLPLELKTRRGARHGDCFCLDSKKARNSVIATSIGPSRGS